MQTLLIILVSFTFTLIIGFLLRRLHWEKHNFVVRNYLVTAPKLDSLRHEIRVVFIGDLHNYCYGKDNDILIQEIIAQEPELILITGDMLVAKRYTSYDVAVRFLQQLPKICPVYYSNGNHEQRLKENPERYGDFEPYRMLLKKAGIHLLENESTTIELRGIAIRITGLELPLPKSKLSGQYKVSKLLIESLIGQVSGTHYEILLAHNPMHYKYYLEWGADLILAGHLHGGIIRIPGWRGLVTPHMQLFPKYSGEITKFEDQTLLVTRGLGSHTIKVRLFNKAEVVCIHLTTRVIITELHRLRLEEAKLQAAYTTSVIARCNRSNPE